jgi:hypothetical protein
MLSRRYPSLTRSVQFVGNSNPLSTRQAKAGRTEKKSVWFVGRWPP